MNRAIKSSYLMHFVSLYYIPTPPPWMFDFPCGKNKFELWSFTHVSKPKLCYRSKPTCKRKFLFFSSELIMGITVASILQISMSYMRVCGKVEIHVSLQGAVVSGWPGWDSVWLVLWLGWPFALESTSNQFPNSTNPPLTLGPQWMCASGCLRI